MEPVKQNPDPMRPLCIQGQKRAKPGLSALTAVARTPLCPHQGAPDLLGLLAVTQDGPGGSSFSFSAPHRRPPPSPPQYQLSPCGGSSYGGVGSMHGQFS